MKLHSPKFEKSLRRRVRSAVKSSRELKREFRAAKKGRWRFSATLLFRLAVSAATGAFLWQMLEKTGHAASALAGVSLWGFLFVFIQAQRLSSCLYSSTDLPVLTLLPVTTPVVFRWELQKSIRGSFWLLLDMLVGFSVLAFWSHLQLVKWIAVIPISAVAWAQVLALSALCVAYLPRFPYHLVSFGFIIIVFLIFVSRSLVGNLVIALIDRCAPVLNLLLPTGWPGSIFGVLLGGQWMLLVLVLPIVATLATLTKSVAYLRVSYQLSDPIMPEAPDLVPEGDDEYGMAPEIAPERPPRVDSTAIEEFIQSRQFLAESSWHQKGWFEGLLWGWLSAREKALSEFVFPNGLSISRPWWRIARISAITCLIGLAAGFISPLAQFWALGAGFFVTAFMTLAQILASGRAFQSVMCSGVNVPLYAGYAIGFRELARFLLKCTLIQSPMVIAFAVTCATMLFYLIHLPLSIGALFGLKAAGLLLVSRFIVVTGSFSSGTDDTSRLRPRLVALFLSVVVVGMAFFALAGASLFMPDRIGSWLLWVLAGFDAYAFFRIYGWFYHRNRFDLMSLPRE